MKFIMLELFYRTLYLLLTTALLTCFTYFTVAIQLEYYAGYFANYYEAAEFAFDQSIAPAALLLEQQHCSRAAADSCCWPVAGNSADAKVVKQMAFYATLHDLINEFFCSPGPVTAAVATGAQNLNCFVNNSYNVVQCDALTLPQAGPAPGPATSGTGATENNDAKAWSFLWISSMTYFFTLQLNVQRLNVMLTQHFCCYLFVQLCIQLHAFVMPALLTTKRLHWLALLHLCLLIMLFYNGFYLLYVSIAESLILEQLDSELQMIV